MDPIFISLMAAANAISFIFHGLHFTYTCSCDDAAAEEKTLIDDDKK
jgi:hypothetical protein